jgi:hypothetical protein
VGDAKRTNKKNVEAHRDFSDLEKHAARYNLWLPEAISLRDAKRRHLKYFTLPGKWSYDVYFFKMHEIIQYDGRGFPGVRFCDNNVGSYIEAKSRLGNTVGKKGNFEDLVLDGEREFWDIFPYDIYNLDFCGTCFPYNQPPFSRTFEAISKIIEDHVAKNYFPFIIFLTMKALASETHHEAKDQLKGNIEENRKNSNFADHINELIPNLERFIENDFANFILISIPKLICHLSKEYCDLDICSRARYARTDGMRRKYHITKFVFKFNRKRQRTLSIQNRDYNRNVLQIMRLDNIINIEKGNIGGDVDSSLRDLKRCVETS